MSIERSIYASLPLGIDQDSPGFQFYTYTPEFKHTAESDTSGVIKGAATAGYVKHSGNEWLTDIPLNANIRDINRDDYPITFPQTAEEANSAELKAQRTHPYTIAYRPVKVGGDDKALFWFGKYMGVEWSGARPGNIYLYSVVCDPADVKRAPVLYCSSPAVCCDIRRSQFFPVSGKPARPGLLKNIKSLDEEAGIAPLEYSAGFEEITVGEITDFITADNNQIILNSMVSALMELKDGNLRRRLVIADEKRNILLWIAALSYVFPLENLREMSFTSYTYAPADFDINGVFEPSLNNCFKDSRSGYDFNSASGSYAVYDFSQDSYAPEVGVKKGLFINMLNSAFKINLSLIDNYKQYVIEHTEYRGLGSDYAKGYSLFACMTGMVKFDLPDAVDFAKKHAKPDEKKRLLTKILDNYEKFYGSESDLSCVNDYLDYCCGSGITSREKIEAFFVEKFNAVFWDNSADDKSVETAEEICRKMCGISDNELAVSFVKSNGTSRLVKLVGETSSGYRIIYINNAVLLYADKQNIIVDRNKDEGKIVTSTISRMISEDTMASVSQIDKYIRENFNILHNTLPRIGLCDSVLCALYDKRLKNCCNKVLDIVSEMYLSGNDELQSQMLSGIDRFEFAKFFAADILLKISKESDIEKRVNGLCSVCKYSKKYAVEFAENIKEIARDSVKGAPTSSPEANLRICYSVFMLYKTLKTECGVDCTAAEIETLYQGYITALSVLYPDYIVEKEHIDKLSEMKVVILKRGGDGCEEVFDIFKSLSVLKENVEFPVKNSCFTAEVNIPYRRVNITALGAKLGDIYLESLGRLCGEFWAENEIIPAFWRLAAPAANAKKTDEINQRIFTVMLKTGLKKIKHNGRSAADAIEFAMVYNYNDVLSSLDSWLDECDVKKSVVDCLAKDYKAKLELKKGADLGILGKVDTVKLGEQLELVKKHYEGSGLMGGLMSLFKRK